MSATENQFTGTWLDAGDRRGQQFSHHAADFKSDETEATPMRHALVEQEGRSVGVWVPSDWTDDQARQALESNW